LEYTTLGKTYIKVSKIGLGGIELSRIDYGKAVNLVKQAIELGINLIDTAHNYLNSETIIGQAIKNYRDSVYICTKSMSTSKKGFLNDLNCSLKNLQTDYIDIFLFHDCSEKRFKKIESNGILDLLLKEKQKGKVRYIGFSTHSPDVIDKFYLIEDFSVLMMPVNFIATEFTQKKIFKRLVKNSIGILGMKPLGGGRILDIELCFKFIKQFKEVIPVVGVENLYELKKDLEYFNDKNSLTADDLIKIRNITDELGKNYCRDCRYCLPCPEGINIPWINFIKTNYKRLSPAIIFSESYIEEVKKVDNCKECKKCEKKCPFGLNIVEMLKENQNYYFKILKEKMLDEKILKRIK